MVTLYLDNCDTICKILDLKKYYNKNNPIFETYLELEFLQYEKYLATPQIYQ